MQIVIRAGVRTWDVDLDDITTTTIAELARLVVPDWSGRLAWVDGRSIEAETPLIESGLLSGATVDLHGDADPVPQRALDDIGGDVLAVVAGPAAGDRHALGPSVVVGRGDDADISLGDPTVSPRHCRITRAGDAWLVDDLGSFNGTGRGWGRSPAEEAASDDPVVSLGASTVEIRRSTADDRPDGLAASTHAGSGLISFNRPPRPAAEPPTDRVEVPDPPAEQRRGAAFSAVALLGPIVMGVVMVQVFGSLRYALFALMAPVMMITGAIASRRRNAKEAKSSRRKFRADLAEFRDALDAAALLEASRRRRVLPDLASISRRAALPSTRLWERRFGHADYLRLRLGVGPVPWEPPIDPGRVAAHDELGAAVAERRTIAAGPLELDLGGGAVVGLVGDRTAALALARSLVLQAACLHGPADLGVAVLSDSMHAPAWDWAKWLPHTMAGEARMLAANAEAAAELMTAIAASHEEREQDGGRSAGTSPIGPALLVVVDDETVLVGKRSPVRSFLQGHSAPSAGIVIAGSADRLPAVCTTVVELHDDLGDATVTMPQRGGRVADVVIDGVTGDHALVVARDLARFDDPEVGGVGAGLPSTVALAGLLGLEQPAEDDVGDAIATSWASSAAARDLSVPIGVGEDGPVVVDLVADGPHALVGGTTGSGKSEFLRSLVMGLAGTRSPDQVVFVLVDYKGGSAFDACAELPHTVGLVTDLDGHLGERALRSLEAELHHREGLLRAAGAQDMGEYLDLASPCGPLPRLVVVVDEFATLAAELPDFMGALVGIAQRGRSLGVHTVLATQRPSGAVNANIKANTNIRVALRVQDAADSADVIDRPDAARIGRHQPGRAFVRLGPGEVVAVQTALSTGSSLGGARPSLRVTPFRFGPGVRRVDESRASETSDLDAMVAGCSQAFVRSGRPAPRRPWLEMIGHLELGEVLMAGGTGHGVTLAIADDPAHQRRCGSGWDPTEGHLALFGAVGSGTTTALVTTSVALAAASGPDHCHLYGIDYGGGDLATLETLPHCGAVVGPESEERQRRLIELLLAEVEDRRLLDRTARAALPTVVVAVDGLPAFLADHDDVGGQDLVDAVRRLFADGPAVRVVAAFTADRPAAVPMRMMGAVTSRYLFRQADPSDLGSIGLKRTEVPDFVVGRAVDATTSLVVQFPSPDGLAASMADLSVQRPARAPMAVESLSVSVALDTLAIVGDRTVGGDLSFPIGIAAENRDVAHLALEPGQDLMVAGQARSGVSTMLRSIAHQVRRCQPDTVLVAVAGSRSPLASDEGLFDAVGSLGELTKVLEVAALDRERAWLIVVDDAHLLDEPGALEPLLKGADHCHLVVGGRSDQLHGQFGHWTRLVRRSGRGLLLHPRLDTDGDLFGVRLPRRLGMPLVAGRGFLVNGGDAELVQFAGIDLAA